MGKFVTNILVHMISDTSSFPFYNFPILSSFSFFMQLSPVNGKLADEHKIDSYYMVSPFNGFLSLKEAYPFNESPQGFGTSFLEGNCASSAFTAQPGNGHFNQLNYPCQASSFSGYALC